MFLWALEFFVKKKNIFYSEVQVKFLRPIILGVKVELQWENKNNELKIKDDNNKVYTIIKYKKKKFKKNDFLIVSDYKKKKINH